MNHTTETELQKTITELAALKDGWPLLADVNPAAFMVELRQEIERLRGALRFYAENGNLGMRWKAEEALAGEQQVVEEDADG